MFFKLFVVCLLATARAAPQDVVEVVAEAVAPVAIAEPISVVEPVAVVGTAAPVVEAVVPVVEAVAPAVVAVEHAINTCRTEFEPLETQTCTPHHERVCAPLEVVNQKIGYEKKCKDVVSIQCPQVGAPVGGTVLVKREADPSLFYNPYGLGLGPIHHVRQTCQEITTQHCVDNPIPVEEPTTVETCHVITKVSCLPHIEHIPRTVCDPVETVVHNTPINPLAYHYGSLFGR